MSATTLDGHWGPSSVDHEVSTASRRVRSVVLVVDDDAGMRELLAAILHDAGHEVRLAADGHRAREVLEQDDEITVLLTDERMPGWTGLELAAWVQAERKALAVVVLTAFARASTEAEALRLGVRRVLSKPFSVAGLLRVVQEVADAQD